MKDDRTGQCWLLFGEHPYVALVISPPESYNDGDDIVHECLVVHHDKRMRFGGLHEERPWELLEKMQRIA